MTLEQFVGKSSKNEQFQITLNTIPLSGHYTHDEILMGMVKGLPPASECMVLKWFSLNDTPTTTYTFVDVREVRYEEIY